MDVEVTPQGSEIVTYTAEEWARLRDAWTRELSSFATAADFEAAYRDGDLDYHDMDVSELALLLGTNYRHGE